MPLQYKHDIQNALRLSANFRFKFGKTRMDSLDTKAHDDIKRIVNLLSRPEYRKRGVILLGFADSLGSELANIKVSRERALVIAEMLKKWGIYPRKVAGYGASVPLRSNDTDEGREKNRRGEVWLSQL